MNKFLRYLASLSIEFTKIKLTMLNNIRRLEVILTPGDIFRDNGSSTTEASEDIAQSVRSGGSQDS